jgi:hypothetical protein
VHWIAALLRFYPGATIETALSWLRDLQEDPAVVALMDATLLVGANMGLECRY